MSEYQDEEGRARQAKALIELQGSIGLEPGIRDIECIRDKRFPLPLRDEASGRSNIIELLFVQTWRDPECIGRWGQVVLQPQVPGQVQVSPRSIGAGLVMQPDVGPDFAGMTVTTAAWVGPVDTRCSTTEPVTPASG